MTFISYVVDIAVFCVLIFVFNVNFIIAFIVAELIGYSLADWGITIMAVMFTVTFSDCGFDDDA
ncbi:MAG: hypothetical protein F6K42_01540 [Leptolyngbya sp. SIO1D8]|nr:hypothetical protein [Leptolyngbya sp. SIO1D8]